MTETRWLDAKQQQIWRSFLFASRLLFAQLERDLQQGADIPLTYYEILTVLSESPHRAIRMNELAEALLVSPSRMSHAVARLEQEGWVRRQLCPSDRRGWLAVLTDTGWDALVAAAPLHVESVRQHLFDQLTPAQLEHLGEISDSLLGHLTAMDGVNPACAQAALSPSTAAMHSTIPSVTTPSTP
jgi:DNA-binding MarR family transcriptional regulator